MCYYFTIATAIRHLTVKNLWSFINGRIEIDHGQWLHQLRLYAYFVFRILPPESGGPPVLQVTDQQVQKLFLLPLRVNSVADNQVVYYVSSHLCLTNSPSNALIQNEYFREAQTVHDIPQQILVELDNETLLLPPPEDGLFDERVFGVLQIDDTFFAVALHHSFNLVSAIIILWLPYLKSG